MLFTADTVNILHGLLMQVGFEQQGCALFS
ncbi:MAG: hypothetical protein CFH02_01891, partial [Alphaproteobacteria bacterium MarineAlpha3_Bin1]